MRPISTILTVAIGGVIAASATATIDGIWSWHHLDQFTPSLSAKLRLLGLLIASYSIAGFALSSAGATLHQLLLHRTRLGDLMRFASSMHESVRLKNPRDAMVGLSVTLVGVPTVFACWFLTHHFLTVALSDRRHLGIMIAIAMFAGMASLFVGALAGFLLGRPVEVLLQRIAKTQRVAQFMSSIPFLLAIKMLLLGAGTAITIRLSWSTLSVLPLRPFVVGLFALALLPPAIVTSRQLVTSWRARSLVLLILVPGLVAMVVTLGSASRVRKAARAYSGFGAPLIAAAQRIDDWDRDGYSGMLGADCDNWNRAIHPGAYEIPGDGIDQNCVGGDAQATIPKGPTFWPLPDTIPPRLNIVLITIDTLRSDHVGAYGYKRETTPHLDALARDGTTFRHAWAHAPSTRYSIPAILTGRLPLDVAYNFRIRGWPGLQPRNTTISEILKQQKFVTGAILNYWYFDRARNMNQGFDSYNNTNRSLHRGVAGQGPAHSQGSSSAEQTNLAIRFIDQHRNAPFFLWVHYYDPHYEYEKHDNTPSFGDETIDLYDHEIRFTDQHIGRLIDHLKSDGSYDRTAFVVTGDHGEGFGEHGVSFHGYHLYAAQTRVPLIIRIPGIKPREVTTPVGHIDILPTLANLAGAKPSDWMQGESLVGWMMGTKPNKERIVLQQLSYEGNNEIRGAASATCHVVLQISPQTTWEVYRVDKDPAEERDLHGSQNECEAVKTALAKAYDTSTIRATK